MNMWAGWQEWMEARGFNPNQRVERDYSRDLMLGQKVIVIEDLHWENEAGTEDSVDTLTVGVVVEYAFPQHWMIQFPKQAVPIAVYYDPEEVEIDGGYVFGVEVLPLELWERRFTLGEAVVVEPPQPPINDPSLYEIPLL